MGARLTPGRLLLCAAAIVALVSVTSACGGGGGDAGSGNGPTVKTYSDRFVSFSYPSTWAASAPAGPTEMHFHPLVYLSTQPVGHPCVVRGNETRCDWPIKNLAPGGVLALWQIPYQLPTVGDVVHQGTQIEVGGHPAWIQSSVDGECRRIGATRTMDVNMADGLALTVCLRAPGTAEAEKSVNELLASVKFASR